MADSKKIAILGFGNPVRSDDALGTYVVEQLSKKQNNYRDVTILDMGTSAFEVLFKLKGHNKIILVDAVINTNEAVGTIFKLPAKEIERAPKDDPLVFLHGMKWDQALSYAKKILRDDYPNDIQVYLVAIENTKLDVSMSNETRKAGDKVVHYIIEEMVGNKK